MAKKKPAKKNTSRFQRLTLKLAKSGDIEDPKALAAAIGQRKAGKRAAQRSNPRKVWEAKQGKATAEVLKTTGGKYVAEVDRGTHHTVETLGSRDAAIAFARVRLHEVATASNSLLSTKDIDQAFSAIPGAKIAQVTGHIAGKVAKKTKRAITKTLKGRKRKNPEESAFVQYERFHGFEADTINEIEEDVHVHEWLWTVGKLVGMKLITVENKQFVLAAPGYEYRKSKDDFQPDPSVPAEDIVFLGCSEDGKQLFAKGGDQSIDFKALGMGERDEHDHMLIGTITQLWYDTRKTFEAGGKEETLFFHDHGAVKEGANHICPVLEYEPRVSRMRFLGGRYYVAPPDPSLDDVSPGIVG